MKKQFVDGRKTNFDLVQTTDLSLVDFMLHPYLSKFNVINVKFDILFKGAEFAEDDGYSVFSTIVALIKGFYTGYVIQNSCNDGKHFDVTFFMKTEPYYFYRKLDKVLIQTQKIHDLLNVFYS